MNDVLCFYTILPFFPKIIESVPKLLRLAENSYTVPADTLIITNTSATHRNPKYWPKATPTSNDRPLFPISSFDPARWLKDGSSGSGRTIFSPEPGSYVPFAEGPRACVGKRFAQAQFCKMRDIVPLRLVRRGEER